MEYISGMKHKAKAIHLRYVFVDHADNPSIYFGPFPVAMNQYPGHTQKRRPMIGRSFIQIQKPHKIMSD